MNAKRQAFPVDPFSYSEPRFLYLAPAIGGRVYCHCFPAKSLLGFCSRECGMAPGFTAAQFLLHSSVCSCCHLAVRDQWDHWDSGNAGGTGAGHARAEVFPAGFGQLAFCCGLEFLAHL